MYQNLCETPEILQGYIMTKINYTQYLWCSFPILQIQKIRNYVQGH